MLKSTICGSVAFRMRSPNFSTLRQAWKGSWSSEPACRVVTKLPREHETAARRSHDHEDGVTVASRRVDAIFTKFKLKNGTAFDADAAPLMTMFGKSNK